MSDYNLALTAAGQALKAKIEAGDGDVSLAITRIVTASGTSGAPLNLTAVVDEKQEFTITDRKVMGARTSITAILTNAGNPAMGKPPVTEGYALSQIGFYALDPDDGEILYRISQFDSPNYVPAASERGWSYEPTFNFVTGNASDVIVNIEPAGFITKQDIWGSIEMSDAETPSPGTRIHFRIIKDAPGYRPYTPTAPVEPEPEIAPGMLEIGGVPVAAAVQLEDGSVLNLAMQKI